jgi:hypothetical protein
LIAEGDPGVVLKDEIVQDAYNLNGSIGIYLETHRTVYRALAVAGKS